MKISVITSFRNRDIERLRYSLNSLSAQTYTDFELIFVDYGSDIKIARDVEFIVQQYSFATYFYNHTQGMLWNRAHAMNTGLKKATGEILLFFDIDLIIEKDFLKKITELNYENNFYIFSCFYLPQHFYLQNKALEKDGLHYEQNYVGLCAVNKNHVFDINGFNEYYMVWGVEDDDFYWRLSHKGLLQKQMKVSEYTVFHQWHSTHAPLKPTHWYLTMVNYLFANNFQNKPDQWGSLIEKNDRPILKKILTDDFDVKLTLYESQLFCFNRIVKDFHSNDKVSGCFIYEEDKSHGQRASLFSYIKKKAIINPPVASILEIRHFFQWLICINRFLLEDYYIDEQENSLKFYYIKKMILY